VGVRPPSPEAGEPHYAPAFEAAGRTRISGSLWSRTWECTAIPGPGRTDAFWLRHLRATAKWRLASWSGGERFMLFGPARSAARRKAVARS